MADKWEGAALGLRPQIGSMAKKTPKEIKPVRKSREPMSPEAAARLRRVVTNVLCGVALAGACAGAFVVSQRYVDRIATIDTPPEVVIKNQPVWMSDTLAKQIVASVQPLTPKRATDHQMLVERANLLAANPWVKRVNAVRREYVNRPGDVIELDCEFRAPVALVEWDGTYRYVDSEGVVLPEKLNAQQVQYLIRPGNSPTFYIIEGVARGPKADGAPWPGGDVQAGIEMVGLLANQPYANKFIKIDVSNFSGRRSPNESQINLIDRAGQEVRWGQPPSSKAFFVEQKVDRKLEVLGRLYSPANREMKQPWIDLRFDTPTVPDTRSRASIER